MNPIFNKRVKNYKDILNYFNKTLFIHYINKNFKSIFFSNKNNFIIIIIEIMSID
jgi:hypothetical protein